MCRFISSLRHACIFEISFFPQSFLREVHSHLQCECFLFQIPVSSLEARNVHFVEFYCICPTNVQCMPTDVCWHKVSMCWTNTVKRNRFPVFPLRSFSSCIPLLPHLPVNSILSCNVSSITGEDISYERCGLSV